MQKTITTDFIEKTRIKNDGSVPQYYVKDSQEAIIPKDIFTEIQEEMARRANMFSGEEDKKRRVYSSKYALSSICTCAKCGDLYRCIAWNNRGKKSTVWRCVTRLQNGPKVCDAPTISEEELEAVTVKAINKVVHSSSTMRDTLKANIEEVISRDKTSEKIEALNKVLTAKQEELMNLARQNKDYSSIANELDELRAQRQKVLVEKSQVESTKRRIKGMDEFLAKESTKPTQYDEGMVRSYIQGIEIYDDHFQVIFKAGVEVEIKR